MITYILYLFKYFVSNAFAIYTLNVFSKKNYTIVNKFSFYADLQKIFILTFFFLYFIYYISYIRVEFLLLVHFLLLFYFATNKIIKKYIKNCNKKRKICINPQTWHSWENRFLCKEANQLKKNCFSLGTNKKNK